jgi:formamidopyrimidine-DNA glycosylase
MPELPEVEITRRHLAEVMEGHLIVEAHVNHVRTARHNGSPGEIEARLEGRRVERVERIGKFINAPLGDSQILVAHLGMSGRFAINDEIAPHTHFSARLDTGDMVLFVDPRTFGFIAVYDEDTVAASGLSRLGRDAWIDPPDSAELSLALVRRTAPIKALLLDQGLIAGLGNIYADEALHKARIHPLRPGASLTPAEIRKLLAAMANVLELAIDNGGTSLDDLAYLLPDGRAGENLERLKAYGRTDLPCLNCGTPIQRLVIRARSSHFCPTCQEPPRG